ncbi:MAG: phytoene desaturase [Cyclobacteriaceae bacterium]|nr:phytoene desaturase [Cyclobacteriaceae bacterium]
MRKKVAVIGSGFAGLSAATCLAREGFDVTVFEKNAIAGGRARQFTASGFAFDMGPSWYWMPDVFERYFARFGKKPSNYYSLKRLDPSYRIYFGANDYMDVPASMDKLESLFESLEPGSSRHLRNFLEEGKFKYELGMNSLVYKPGLSLLEFADREVITGALRLHLFKSITQYLKTFFRNERILKLLEFPVLFLGATAEKTPALYSLMNYADIVLGTWYPKGGMYSIVAGMEKLAVEQGVKFQFSSAVEQLPVENGKATGVIVNGALIPFDYIVAGADYHHVEQHLLPEQYRRYSPSYWNKRVMAPSSLLFYLGLNKRVSGLLHHTLFFDEDFTRHSREIYEEPQWPSAPQFYVSCASQTDNGIAPEGGENLVILIPVAPGLADTDETREKYYTMVMARLEKITGQSLLDHVIYKRTYAHADFIQDYNAFKGNAYGLANTLLQTANLKPSILNKKVSNLFYTGQLTVPGPGVPPSLISGQVVADQIIAREK